MSDCTCFLQLGMMKHSKSYQRPYDFPGDEEDWYYYLLSVEMETIGSTPNFDPLDDSRAIECSVNELFAKSRTDRLVGFILDQDYKEELGSIDLSISLYEVVLN